MKLNTRIKDRINWLNELYQEILKETKDPEIAKIIYRRVVFEEQSYKGGKSEQMKIKNIKEMLRIANIIGATEAEISSACSDGIFFRFFIPNKKSK